MKPAEDRIAAARKTVAPLVKAAADEATGAYCGRLAGGVLPGKDELAAARDAAQSALKRRVFSAAWLGALAGGEPPSPEKAAALELAFDRIGPRLVVPPPEAHSELTPSRVALAAALGAVAGLMILGPLARLLLDMRDAGLLIGAPLGAGLVVLGLWRVSESKWLQAFLVGTLAAATAAEVWAMVTPAGWFRWLWDRLGGRYSGLGRILLYLGLIGLLLLVRRRTRYDRAGYERVVRAAVEQWLAAASVTLAVLLPSDEHPPADPAARERLLSELLEKVQELPAVPPESLPVAIGDLIQGLRNRGLSAETPAATFAWAEAMAQTYDTFGLVEPGDAVRVERPPVVLDGSVRRKGLVRRVRERR